MVFFKCTPGVFFCDLCTFLAKPACTYIFNVLHNLGCILWYSFLLQSLSSHISFMWRFLQFFLGNCKNLDWLWLHIVPRDILHKYSEFQWTGYVFFVFFFGILGVVAPVKLTLCHNLYHNLYHNGSGITSSPGLVLSLSAHSICLGNVSSFSWW